MEGRKMSDSIELKVAADSFVKDNKFHRNYEEKTIMAFVDNLRLLKDQEIIQVGDIVFNDFGTPIYAVGAKHNRVGTPWEENLDMPVKRNLY
jgi:hypothetical protein